MTIERDVKVVVHGTSDPAFRFSSDNRASGGHGWQPIETVSSYHGREGYGGYVLIADFADPTIPSFAAARLQSGQWVFGATYPEPVDVAFEPTHWMPLPEAPE